MLLMALSAAGCGGGGGTTTPSPGTQLHPEDLVPDVTVQVVDHRFRNADWSGDNLDPDPIFSLIASASASLDIAFTSIDRQDVVLALLAEAKSGTRVRIITEKAFYDDPAFKPFYNQLEDASKNGGNIEIRTDKEGLPREMHARFMVIDQARVVTGSYNWESESADRTFGDVVSILNTNVAAAFTNQFNQMFVEGNFGVHKRNDTQHSFLVGGGNGLVEVYFGPTDQPEELIKTEMNQSQSVFFAVQQFKSASLASYFFNFLGSSANNEVIGIINDNIDNVDSEEQAVYNGFFDYTQQDKPVGKLLINSPIDPTGSFANYNTMNHKLLFADHALSNGQPAIVDSTANFSSLGFSQNDEVFLVFRGTPVLNKYLRSVSLNSTTPPASLINAGDVQEINQLLAMWPFVGSSQFESGADFRNFMNISCGIIFGEVTNFTPTVSIQNTDGTFEKVPIDLTFTISASTFFSSLDVPESEPVVNGDIFVSSETLNPKHRYLLVVPAGTVTVKTIVMEGDQASGRFQDSEKTFQIGPCGVRKMDLQINPAGQDSTGGTTGGGGGAGV
jgi:phosphatidylserine/phosphatidylglycerophosphate/cardiolipin synthase-like enzyme